jgi:hypothetical protein
MKIRKSPHSVGPAFQPEARHCWPGQVAPWPSRPKPAGAARALNATTCAATRWCGRRGFTGGLGLAHPVGTPRGSDSGGAGQGGASGSHRRRPAAVGEL